MGAGPEVQRGEVAMTGALAHGKADGARELTSSRAAVRLL